MVSLLNKHAKIALTKHVIMIIRQLAQCYIMTPFSAEAILSVHCLVESHYMSLHSSLQHIKNKILRTNVSTVERRAEYCTK